MSEAAEPLGEPFSAWPEFVSEAKVIIDAAHDRGLHLRLLGALAVIEQCPNHIWLLEKNATNETKILFADLRGEIRPGEATGLLGLAFHPQYASNGFFYVDYIDHAGNTVVARYHVSANPAVADPSSATVLLTQTQPFTNHNGGQLRFGECCQHQ